MDDIPEELVERICRDLCEQHTRKVRRHDTAPRVLEAKLPAWIDYAWRDFIPEARSAIRAVLDWQAKEWVEIPRLDRGGE